MNSKRELTENEISRHIVNAAIETHINLGGPGLLEAVYERALAWELRQRGLKVDCQKIIPITYKGMDMDGTFRVDMLVNDKVVVECKAVSTHNPIFESQVLTYIRQMDLKLGLVVNFGMKHVAKGIHRVVNGL